jgi:hypothetical protein
LAVENGLKGIHFIGRSAGWLNQNKEILDLGFDGINSLGEWRAESAASGKTFNILRHKLIKKFGGLILQKYNYEKIIKHMFSPEDKDENIYPTIVPQWDRSPRSGRRAIIYHGSTPELFGEHIEQAFDLVKDKEEEHKIIFLKSWNEWGEGNYIEPDIKYGMKYLDELKKRLLK